MMTLRRSALLKFGHGLVRVAVLVMALVVSATLFAQDRSTPIPVVSQGVTFSVDAPSEMHRFAVQTAEVVSDCWPAMAARAGADGVAEISVSVERDISDWFERRDVPPRNPEWAAGLAIYSESAVIIRTANPEWKSTLCHELAHMAVDMAAGGRSVPRWFNEGFAVMSAEQWSVERASTMIRAGLSGNFYSFDELTPGFPAAGSSAELAYAQSFHFVRFVETEFGTDVFVQTLAGVKNGLAWNAAFESVTGRTLSSIEEDWVEHVSTRYKWAPAVAGGGGAWTLMAGLSLLAWRRHKKRSAARLAALAVHEASVYSPDPDDDIFG